LTGATALGEAVGLALVVADIEGELEGDVPAGEAHAPRATTASAVMTRPVRREASGRNTAASNYVRMGLKLWQMRLSVK
jgi:hypothetical protein